MAQVMNADWIDDNGKPFRSTVVAAYDPFNNIYNLPVKFVIQELNNDNPLLYANRTHAMVLGDFDYIIEPDGNIKPLRFGVIDPWPFSQPYRFLSWAELVPAHLNGEMKFLAAVHIQDL